MTTSPSSCIPTKRYYRQSPCAVKSLIILVFPKVAQIISKLEKKKFEAVSTERFEYAKKIKSAIGELREAGLILGSLEMEKQIYADTGRYRKFESH